MRGLEGYYFGATAKPNEEAQALETIYRENERVKRFGFTQGELDRAKTNMLVGLELSLIHIFPKPHATYTFILLNKGINIA